jgi:hypothetical protein
VLGDPAAMTLVRLLCAAAATLLLLLLLARTFHLLA